MAAIGARAYGYQDGSSNWSRMPAAVAAPVRASAGQTIVDLDGNVLPLGGEQGVFTVFNNAKDFNLDVAQVKDQLLAQIRLIGVNPKNIPAYLKDLYDQLDAIQRGKPAAGPSYVAPYGMGARGSSASAAQYQKPNAAVEQEMLALAAEKAAGSYFTGRNATIDDFIATYDRSDPATKEKIVEIYTKLKKRDGEGYVIGGMANDIKRTGIFAFLAGHGDDAPVPAASARDAAAPHYAVSPEAAAQMEMRNLIERKKKGPYGPSGLFINFAGIFDSLSQDQRNTLVRVYDKLKSRDGVDSAITTIALEYGNEGLEGMVRRHLENPLPAAGAGGGYGYGAQGYPPRAAEAVDDFEIARQLDANERYGFAYDSERRAAEEAAGLQLAQRLQAEEEEAQRQRYAYPAAQDFGAGGAAAAYRPQDAVAPIVAAARAALKAAAVPAPNADVAPEEFNDREMRILYDAYNVVMQRIQRPNAARIQQLEKEIHTQQRVLDSVAAEVRMAYSAAQIAYAKRELETLVAERERLAKEADDIMNEYAGEFNGAATPLLKARTPGAQAIMGALQENRQNISYGKILSFLNQSMGW